jgi:hypothetical protein
MELVGSWADIQRNIDTLAHCLDSSAQSDRDFACHLVKRGICFIVTTRSNTPFFAPSRFVGYTNNTRALHIRNEAKDGRETNPVLSKILGFAPQPNDEFDLLYRSFCRGLGIIPGRGGNFGIARKYWDARDL